MTRSQKRRPIGGIGNSSNRWFAGKERRKERKAVKTLINDAKYEFLIQHEPVSHKQFGNEWESPRDGKWFLYTECEKRIKYGRRKSWGWRWTEDLWVYKKADLVKDLNK